MSVSVHEFVDMCDSNAWFLVVKRVGLLVYHAGRKSADPAHHNVQATNHCVLSLNLLLWYNWFLYCIPLSSET